MSTIKITTSFGPGAQGATTGPGFYTFTSTISLYQSNGGSTSFGPSSATTSPASHTSVSNSDVATFGGQGVPSLISTTSQSASSKTASAGSTASAASSATGSITSTASGVANSSPPAAASSPGSSNTALIAVGAVLGVLLAIALAVILFLLLRQQRRSKYAAGAANPSSNRDMAEVGTARNKQRHTISSTEVEQSLLAGTGRSAAPVLDDKQANSRFAKLNQEINDWVLTYFRNINPRTRSTSQEMLQGIRNQPHYKELLQDSRGKYLVLRGLVADGLTDAFDNGEINGFGDVFGMKERFPTNVGARDKAAWRSSTVLLLEKDNGFRERQARAVETVAQRINYVVASVAGAEYSEARLRHLTTVVQSAADIALHLAKQRMNFVLVHPSEDSFDPVLMDDVLQESRSEQLRGARVLSVVFPAVVRYGDEAGEGFEHRKVISRALVLASSEGHAI